MEQRPTIVAKELPEPPLAFVYAALPHANLAVLRVYIAVWVVRALAIYTSCDAMIICWLVG